MHERLNDTIKKYKNTCDYMEIRIEDIDNTHIFLNTENTNVSTFTEFGGNVRVLIKGGWGFASFNDLNLLEAFVEKAINQAGKFENDKRFLSSVPVVTDNVKLEAIVEPRGITLKDKVKLFSHYNNIILNYDKSKIKNSCIVYLEQYKKKYFTNSEGSYIEQELLDLNCDIKSVAKDNGKINFSQFTGGSSNDFSVFYNLEEEVEKGCYDSIIRLDAKKIEGGTYTVIGNTGFAGTFAHEAFGHNCEADQLKNEDTKKEMRRGRPIGSKILNVYDTGLEVGTRGYMKYDDEGVKSNKTYLIKEGVLHGKLHTRETAYIFKEEPTGSAKAIDYRFPPICRMINTCIEKGESSFHDMIKDVKKGLYVSGSCGGVSGENFLISPGCANMIRNGEIAEPVMGVKITGNIFKTLENIDMIGSDFNMTTSFMGCARGEQYFLPLSYGGPSIRIQDVIVGGKL